MRKFRWLLVVMVLVQAVALAGWFWVARMFQEPDFIVGMSTAGLLIGIGCGFMVGMLFVGLFGSIASCIQGFRGFRVHRMLIKYYDMAVTDDPVRDYDNLMAPQAAASQASALGMKK